MCFGPARGRKVTYSSPRRLIPGFRPDAAEAALAALVRSYLHAYGPATPARVAHVLEATRTTLTIGPVTTGGHA